MKDPFDPVVSDLADKTAYYVDSENRLMCKAMKCPFCKADLWIKTMGVDFFENVCPNGCYTYILRGE